MSETIVEETVEVLPSGFVFGATTSNVIIALAFYGAASMTEDVVSLTKKIVRNRKAKKAAKKVETDTPQQ